MKRFARDRTISPHVARKQHDPQPSSADVPVILTPTVEDVAPRWRSIAITIRADELDSIEGYDAGMVDELVRLARAAHLGDLQQSRSDGEPLVQFVATSGDQVVWDGNRVVAILRVLADGTIDDARFAPSGPLDRQPCQVGEGVPG